MNTELVSNSNLQGALVLKAWADAVISNVEHESDDRLIEFAQSARSLSTAAFRVRGACALELKSRIKARLAAQGKSEPGAIGKQMAALAQEIGVAAKTLSDDAHIVEVFSDILRGETELDREYFLRALPAPDPHAAIEFAAHMKATTSGFSAEDLRQHVILLNQGQDKEKLERESFIKIKLTDEGKAAAEYLPSHLNKSLNVLVNELLIERAAYSREVKK